MRLSPKQVSALGAITSVVVLALACRTMTAPALGAQQVAVRSAALRPGIVVDAAAGVAYVMVPAGGIAAVDLASGATRWTSSAADKPLALVGDLLVAQVEPRTPGNRLEVVTLRTRARGERGAQGATTVAPGVRVSLGETLEGTFHLTARPSGGDVFLLWSFVPVPRRGMEDQQDSVARPALVATRPVIRRGALRFRVSTGAVTPLDTNRVGPSREPQWILPQESKLTGAAPTQYESADGRHIVASERVADDRVWDKYRWTVYERAGARRLGEFRTHVSFSPFVVRDSLVVFETTPYVRGGQAAEPAKLRAFSLASGREVWSVPVREIVYRGPYPP